MLFNLPKCGDIAVLLHQFEELGDKSLSGGLYLITAIEERVFVYEELAEIPSIHIVCDVGCIGGVPDLGVEPFVTANEMQVGQTLVIDIVVIHVLLLVGIEVVTQSVNCLGA